MIFAVLFTWPNRHLGPAQTNLFRVKGMAEIVVACDGTEWRYRDAVSATRRRMPNAETAVLLLRHDDEPVNLAAVPDAIAVAIVDGKDGRIFWFDEDQSVRVEPVQMMPQPRASIEGICCPPGGYQLKLKPTELIWLRSP